MTILSNGIERRPIYAPSGHKQRVSPAESSIASQRIPTTSPTLWIREDIGAVLSPFTEADRIEQDVQRLPPICVHELDMWHFLEDSYRALPKIDKEKVEKETGSSEVKFSGFDANNEPHYGIMSYLITRLHRFEYFKDHNLDSHSPRIDRFKAMYRIFEPLRKDLGDRLLTADEIVKILLTKRMKVARD